LFTFSELPSINLFLYYIKMRCSINLCYNYIKITSYDGATTLSLTTLSITTLSIDIQHNGIECHYAECRDYLNVMLSVLMLNVIMLSVVRLNVAMLSVVEPI
jgi:hypothetical protein